MTIRTLLATPAIAAGLLLLSACGGGSGVPMVGYVPTAEGAPQEGFVSWSKDHHDSIGFDGRQDYKGAMYDDCVKNDVLGNCSMSGHGWFERWSQVPVIVVPRSSSREEVWAIKRALAVLNRSLPGAARLKGYYTDISFVGIDRHNANDHVERLVPVGAIHAEIYPYDDPDSGGFGWTDGQRGYAVVDEGHYFSDGTSPDLANGEDMRSVVDTLVHEFLHALGLLGHPHPVHTSILSYRHHREGELDNVPLVDVAVLYDMYGFGYWAGDMGRVVDTVDGVQFGVHRLHYGSGSALIPWVNAGYMTVPEPDALLGRASYKGNLVGHTASGFTASGDTRLSVNFDTGAGSARFEKIQAYDGTKWSMWNRRGFRYDLNLYAHYFDSSTDSRDQDGIPDVVGAFYGRDAEVAAGTLQRSEITAAFGTEQD